MHERHKRLEPLCVCMYDSKTVSDEDGADS